MIITIESGLELHLLAPQHEEELYELADRNREHLRPWLSWVDQMLDRQFIAHFIRSSAQRNLQGLEYAFVILNDGRMIGRLGLYRIDSQNHHAEIGYWIDQPVQGRGIITRGTEKLMEFGFGQLNLNRIEIRCATGNKASQSVPKRLGFTLEAVLRKSERVGDEYHDCLLFSILKEEFLSR